MKGIGIDTGGTYTDAVVYELNTKEVLASAKALTTKDDLKIGIRNVLEKLPRNLLDSCETLSLSTTLTTNACVENRGGKGKLVFIGLSRDTLEETYQDYGIDSLDDVYLLECKIEPSKAKSTQPDWDKFRQDLPEFCKQCDCISIVQLFAKDHYGSYEKKAASIVKEVLDIPVILGNDLFPDLNIIRRGAGALLNARLVPVINEFLTAIKEVFHSYHLTPPMIIVKSDGTLMSEKYTSLHPVETLLCGPAASIIGAAALTDTKDALVIDMGGTTTDIAIIKNNVPKTVENGIQVGDWKTFVKGLFIDTFALGGDTAVHYNFQGALLLEKYRIIPLCTLASTYPDITAQMQILDNYPNGHNYPLHEFFCLVKDIEDSPHYTEREKNLCRALKSGPLIFSKAAESCGCDFYTFDVRRLEEDGIIMRAGLTPTDVMHIKGDFAEYSRGASLAAARFVAAYAKMSIQQLCDKIYDMVNERLYCNLVRILLQEEYFSHKREDLSKDLTELIRISYQRAKNGETNYFSNLFRTKATLIAVGAPTHIFIDAVAKMLGTTSVVPKYASVANAIGAIVGNISATRSVEIRPHFEDYKVTVSDDTKIFSEYEDALQYALEMAEAAAIEAARQQGAFGHITTASDIRRKSSQVGESDLLLRETVSVTATGKAY